uniref:Protein YAE1 n=1 Tax=Melanopsichium pennsylvanicum 4 TaxID=1398559 RepID=A0A077R624_9BASI|nr:conserved hypothetical protein [Melanopsichium pennsylvanicum 4]
MDGATHEAGPSSMTTPRTDQSEWASASTPIASSTPSRQTFPRRLSLLQNDISSPVRPDIDGRRTSFTGGPKPLSLGSQSIVTAQTPTSASSGTDTPRRGNRTSLSYIPSPSTSIKTDDNGVGLARNPSTSSASGRTRTGSISRATATTRRRPSQTSNYTSNNNDDDWLMSEEDVANSLTQRSMGERDTAKVENLFNDTGYREGITAGKLSTLQNGFDQGFNEVGALLGRQVGLLQGQIAALLLLTSPAIQSSSSASARKGAALSRNRPTVSSAAGAGSASSLALLQSPRLEEAKVELRELAEHLDTLTLAKLADPDYEAMEHELEHQDGADRSSVKRETEAEKSARQEIMKDLERRLQANGNSRRTLSQSSTLSEANSSNDLLHQIAEKERRCFELREELASEEVALKSLRTQWQRLATKTLAYSSSSSTDVTTTTSHRRDLSTTSSNSAGDAAAEAWNTLSSKLPGSLKTQLNNLLESIANVDQPPEPIEKQSPLLAKANLHAAPGGGEAGLRVTNTGLVGGLGVLEEEGSDVGSVALSPRSPRSPAVSTLQPTPHASSCRNNLHQAHPQLSSLAKSDSDALGFSVDSNGIATRSLIPIPVDDDLAPPPPPIPPKTESMRQPKANTWASRRTSMLGSFSSLSAKLDEGSKEGGGFASMLSKRFREAKDGASDLLREAERKLGSAMTIDDLLGVNPASSGNHASAGSARRRSPQITLDEPSLDSNYTHYNHHHLDHNAAAVGGAGAGAAEISPWYEAAGGRRSSESGIRKSGLVGAVTASSNLLPTAVSTEAESWTGRLSTSSSRSSCSNLSVPARAVSPHASPPVGGAPGSAGVFGMLMRRPSSENEKRLSGDTNTSTMTTESIGSTPKLHQDLI